MLSLKIYVAGMTPAAQRALLNLREICEGASFSDRYAIEVIDIINEPHLAEEARILVTPTVVRELPPPARRVIGDLSDREQALAGLELMDG